MFIKEIRILEFKPRSVLKWWHNVRHPYFIYPDESVRCCSFSPDVTIDSNTKGALLCSIHSWNPWRPWTRLRIAYLRPENALHHVLRPSFLKYIDQRRCCWRILYSSKVRMMTGGYHLLVSTSFRSPSVTTFDPFQLPELLLKRKVSRTLRKYAFIATM